ncbi:Apple-like protein [Artemisia annua]|uniref:Apple-like protein n=1 Tax=Artemisia annua TaxID=35608 RepID=A0A2U1QIM5_ARTAN|nr:Apple-like protein [Artemisia annua]
MNLTESGNLVLFNVSGSVVWQSFDYPTDCLVLGQRLYQGQQLVPSASSTNSTAEKGIYSLQVTEKGLFAYVGSNPPQIYRSYLGSGKDTNEERSYVRFLNGSLAAYLSSAEPDDPDFGIPIPQASSFQYIKLMPNGHLELIVSQSYNNWSVVQDILTYAYGECGYPLVCGRNGLCRGNQQCTCPTRDYFKLLDDYQPELGCSEITPLTCDSKQDQEFIPVKNTCKQACLNNCLCKAALFMYSNYPKGYCYLPSELYSMFYVDPGYNATAFIKVQKVRPVSLSPTSHQNQVSIIIGSTIGSFVLLVVVSVGFRMFVVQKRKKNAQREEEYLDQVPGMPTRFSYEELKSATQNFSKKLGEGGFGTVFEGILEDGSKIAVKCLEGLTHIKKSFLAEVESIGSIHHVNLVRLRGFCAWKSQRLLVYEFMSNGSLDLWIYHGVREHVLEWECIKKIILDVAKGLVKNFDISQPDEKRHLLGMFEKCWEQGTLLDMVDGYNEDMKSHGTEVVEMMKLASWCLQTDYTRRPSMSSVVKVLEGGMNVESNLDYNFTDPRMKRTSVTHEKEMTVLMPSFLSGPR